MSGETLLKVRVSKDAKTGRTFVILWQDEDEMLLTLSQLSALAAQVKYAQDKETFTIDKTGARRK